MPCTDKTGKTTLTFNVLVNQYEMGGWKHSLLQWAWSTNVEQLLNIVNKYTSVLWAYFYHWIQVFVCTLVWFVCPALVNVAGWHFIHVCWYYDRHQSMFRTSDRHTLFSVGSVIIWLLCFSSLYPRKNSKTGRVTISNEVWKCLQCISKTLHWRMPQWKLKISKISLSEASQNPRF